MHRSSVLAGIIGLILLIFGILDYFIAAGFKFFVLANLIIGSFALVIWATTSSFEAVTESIGSRRTKYGANALVYSAAFIALLIGINYIAGKNNYRYDTTEEKIFSLSDQSLKVLHGLKQPLTLVGFFQGGDNDKARELYQAYQYASPKVSFELVDPNKHPELAERYNVNLMGTTRIEYGKSGVNVTDLTEENLTNAIVKVTKGSQKTIEFLEGEGEANAVDKNSPEGISGFREALEGEGYKVWQLPLVERPNISHECDLLIVAGATREVSQHVVEQIDAYLKAGGRVMMMLRPPLPDEPDPQEALLKLAHDWGIDVGDNVLVDQVVRLYAGPALGLDPIVSKYGIHNITINFRERTVFPMSRSVTAIDPSKSGIESSNLAYTSRTSWGETDLVSLFKKQTASFNPGQDLKGPVSVGAAVDANLKTLGDSKDPSKHARLVVWGSSDFVDNQYLNQFYNRDLIVNSVDWLTGEENSISIRPRTLRASSFNLTVDQFSLVFALSVLLLPEVLLIAGVAVWWERRN